MTLLTTLKKKLPAETLSEIMDALGDNFDWDVVPRSRLNQVIKERNDLREQVNAPDSEDDKDDSDTTPESTKSGRTKDSEKSDSDEKKTKTFTQADLDAAIADAKAEAEKAVDETKFQLAVTAKLREAKVRDPEYALTKMDREKLSLNDKGEIEGLDQELSSFKENYPWHIGDISDSGTGASGKSGSQTNTLDELNQQYSDAVKEGNTPMAVALKNRIAEFKE